MDMKNTQRDYPLVFGSDNDFDFEPTLPHCVVYQTGTFTANRSMGLGQMGACEGQVLDIKRQGAGAFSWSIKNGTAAGGTVIATFPASQVGSCRVKYNGSAWELVGGVNIEEHDLELHGTFTWDPGSLAAGAQEINAAIAAPGAVFGDYVEVVPPYTLQGCQLTAYVHAADTLGAVVRNGTAGAIDLASGTWKYRVRRGR